MQKKQKPQQKPSTTPRQVRIIGGEWKRTPLAVPAADGLRPTPDRVRETLFNWLNHLFDGAWQGRRCLDLFAGTGALGFEAASRGAAAVMLVEDNLAALRQLEATKEKLKAPQLHIRRGDALAVCRNLVAEGARFDLIFLDPPYHRDWLVKVLPLCRQLLTNSGLVYAEAETPLDGVSPPDWMSDWQVLRADRAGMVYYHLLQCNALRQFQA